MHIECGMLNSAWTNITTKVQGNCGPHLHAGERRDSMLQSVHASHDGAVAEVTVRQSPANAHGSKPIRGSHCSSAERGCAPSDPTAAAAITIFRPQIMTGDNAFNSYDALILHIGRHSTWTAQHPSNCAPFGRHVLPRRSDLQLLDPLLECPYPRCTSAESESA